MDDLISRQAAIDALISFFGLSIEEEYGSAIQEVLNGLPSAQSERKKGKWVIIDSDEEKYEDIKCPNCKMNFTVDACRWCDIGFTVDDLKFCPNCGAKMEKEA